MDPAKLSLATLTAVGCGIVLGFAANPTLRTFPGEDWRERYRTAATTPQDPPPQPGVSYYGDGSTAWVYGVPLTRAGASPQGAEVPIYRETGYRDTALQDEPGVITEEDAVAAGAAERAQAQAVVASALARSAPAESRAATPDDDAAPGAASADEPVQAAPADTGAT